MMLERNGAGDGRDIPAERTLQRHDQDARGSPHADPASVAENITPSTIQA
jgi:hypothetical protein